MFSSRVIAAARQARCTGLAAHKAQKVRNLTTKPPVSSPARATSASKASAPANSASVSSAPPSQVPPSPGPASPESKVPAPASPASKGPSSKGPAPISSESPNVASRGSAPGSSASTDSASKVSASKVSASAASATTASASTTSAPVSSATRSHKVVIVGGGSAGLAISHQLLRTGKFSQDDVAIIDAAAWHHYQPGWTLVGGGLKNKEDLKRPLNSLIDPKLKFYQHNVSTFAPEENTVKLGNGDKLAYEQLVVVPGINIDYRSIKGLPEALANPNSLVSTIYGYETCDKVFKTIAKLEKGNAIFNQPAGVIKCAGAPQKVMWLALDYWKRAGLYSPETPSASPIKISFATGTPTMFGVPKYSAKLEELRKERGVEGLFQHDLIAVDGNTAVFARPDGKDQVVKPFDLLHVVPKMGPHAFVKNSPLADAAGFVDVDQATTRHTKYHNVWSSGDASSLPTSKTAAAITSQAPILVNNLLRSMEGKAPEPKYDGYTSCPLTTEYGKVLLAEFKYGGVPKETFGDLIGFDQAVPRRAFYHLKKDFFPWVYYSSMVKGTWAGPNGWIN